MDNEAFELLYKEYYREIYFYLYSMSKNPQLAEELAQETFFKAILALPTGHPNVRAWLYTVARNLFFNHRKSSDHVLAIDDARIADDIQGSDLLSDIMRAENRLMLFSAMQSLSATKREVLQLQYFSGLSQREIAGILNLSAENVRVISLRAKRELKKYLEDNGYDLQ